MKQTAVEWLIDQLNEENHLTTNEINRLVEQAKEMEEKQIRKAYSTGYNESSWGRFSDSEQYYNETFKSENIVMFMTPENGEIESIILTDNPDCGVKGITFKSE